MTFGVTPEGFKAKKFDDIIQEIADSLKSQLNIDIDSSPDSVAKVLTNIYALALAEEWALPQALQSMFDIDKAEGKHLDDLVGYVGLTRLQAENTSGKQYVTTTSELTIPTGSVFKDVSDNEYTNTQSIFISLLNCVDCEVEVADSVSNGDILTVVVNGVSSSISVTTTVETAVSILANDINAKVNGVNASSVDKVISITNTDDTNITAITLTSNFTTNSITSFGNAELSIEGDIGVPAGQVNIPPNFSSIVSTTNRYDYTTGRYDESDQDLRNRHKLSLSRAGSATVEAIRADLLEVNGVSSAFVLENDTLSTDINNIPPKSFLSVIKGGLEQDIGNSLWLTKPAGISTYGDINVTVVDSQGSDQVVSFSRPEPVYIHMKVDYTIYSEESDQFPIDGEQQIINQILTYGQALDLGEDVIPQRFSSEIFQNIGGLQRVDIYIGGTVSPNDPTPALVNQTLPIGALAEADFDETRITVVEV